MFVNLKKLINIIYNNGITLKIESRKKIKAFHYGFPKSHAEILTYYNYADGDLWDAVILGYKNFKPKFNTEFFSNNLIGIIFVENGNHKLIFKVPNLGGFDENKYYKDIDIFMSNYSKKNKLGLKYVDIKLVKSTIS